MMKLIKIVLVILLVLVVLAIYLVFNHPTVVKQKVLQPVIEYQCAKELSSSDIWKTASLFMSNEQQEKNQNTICSCIGQHAMDNVSFKELIHALIDEQEKEKFASKAVQNSIRGCARDALLKNHH